MSLPSVVSTVVERILMASTKPSRPSSKLMKSPTRTERSSKMIRPDTKLAATGCNPNPIPKPTAPKATAKPESGMPAAPKAMTTTIPKMMIWKSLARISRAPTSRLSWERIAFWPRALPKFPSQKKRPPNKAKRIMASKEILLSSLSRMPSRKAVRSSK